MKAAIGFVLFVSVFVAICGLCNYYVLWRFAGFFGIKRGALFWIVGALLTLSYIATIWLHDALPGRLTALLHDAASLWLGIGLLLVSTLLVFEVVKYVVKVPPPIAGVGILAVVSALTAYSMYNARRVCLNEVAIPAAVDVNIVHLSDLHLGSDGRAFLHRVVDMTNAANPDVVLITGDLVDPRSGITADTLASFDKLKAPIFFVTGNHERYAGVAEVTKLLAATHVKILRNEAVECGDLQVIGIDDSSSPNQVADVLTQIPVDPAKYSVIMYHRPKGLEAAAAAGIDLMLAGHTHNGQIAPFNLVVKLSSPRIRGLYRYRDSFLMVSPGAGTWGPKMRLGSHNEVILLKLRKSP